MLIDAHHIINENNTTAFKVSTDLLAPPETGKGIFSDSYNQIVRYEFFFRALGRIVEVVWSEDADESYSERIPDGAVVYDTLGREITVSDNYLSLTPETPVFIVH